MPPATVCVFVSSTWLDLQSERASVEAALQRLRETKFTGMEYFGSREETTLHASLAEVDRSHVYVGIIGGRYGSGITEAEYHRARTRELPCFLYIKDETQITAEGRDAEPEKAARLAEFKAALHRAHTVTLFTTPDDLSARLTADLHRWLFDVYLGPWLARAAQREFLSEEVQDLLDAIKDSSVLSQELRTQLREVGYILSAGSRSVAAQTIKDSTITTGDVHYHYAAARLPSGAPNQAPPLPAHFVPRPEVSERVKAQLLATKSTTPGILVVSAIHGLGGIGKSTLAAALAYDSTVLTQFADGILWATLGQMPNLLSLVSGWVQAVGDFTFHPTTVEAASSHLRSLLYEKAMLLVVDDAWDVAHVRPFLAGGPRCRVLVTTRDALIAQAANAALYDLDVMTPAQALTLVAGRLGRALTKTEQAEAATLADLVGYLPLALELAAAQVADGVSWTELEEDLRPAVGRLQALDLPGAEEVTDEATRKRLSLQASFHLSLTRLPTEKREAFTWLGVLPEDVTVTAAMAATLWDGDSRAAREILRYLRSKAFLLPGAPQPDSVPTYRQHDLLHYLAGQLLTAPITPIGVGELPGLALSLREAHVTLLQRYRARTKGNLWHTLPDDGYIHAHLSWHLEQADWDDELYALLREETLEGRNGWYEVRERSGQIAGYLGDTTRAWQLAHEAFQQQQSPIAIGLQCRYALITASLTSMAENIPETLVIALVQERLWTPAEGLVYAQYAPNPAQKASELAKLATYLPPKLLQEALAAARAIGSESFQALALAQLARRLAELGHPAEALAVARAIGNESAQAQALTVQALTEVAGHMAAPEQAALLQEALAAARAIRGESSRAQALTEVAGHVAAPERTALLQEALAAARALGDESSRAQVLTELARRLAELPCLNIYLLWQETLPMIATRSRAQFLADLLALEPVLSSLGGEQALGETVSAIQDVCRWWP